MEIVERTQLPVSYRQEIVSPVMQCILAGESVAIVGIAGTGKSNLMRLLARPDVQERYLGARRNEFLFLFVDFNRLAGPSEWGFWELLLHRVVTALTEARAEPQLLSRLGDLHERAARSRDELVAQRCFEACVGILCVELNRRLVFLFDPFDEVWRSLRCPAFQVLRSLRDEFKFQLSFVVATRDELSRLREDLDGCRDFYEVVSLNTTGLGPHSEADARNQVARFVTRKSQALAEAEVERLMRLTARHPGLLKAAYYALAEDRIIAGEQLVKALVQDSVVRRECDEIWQSLGDDERTVLVALAAGRTSSPDDQRVIRFLKLKNLLTANENRPFCELFEAYIGGLTPSGPRSLLLDESSGRVVIEGRPIVEELTRTELSLLSHMVGRRGKVCSRKELMHVIYPDEEWTDEDALYDRRLDTIIRRLRDKIEPDRKCPTYVLTVRDRGYKLARDDTEESST